MKNIEVIKAFINQEAGDSLNIHSNGEKLFSYDTCIAEWYKGLLVINKTRYSVTTSKHQTYLLRWIPSYIKVIELKAIPKNTSSLKKFMENLL